MCAIWLLNECLIQNKFAIWICEVFHWPKHDFRHSVGPPREENARRRTAGSFPEQRLVSEPTTDLVHSKHRQAAYLETQFSKHNTQSFCIFRGKPISLLEYKSLSITGVVPLVPTECLWIRDYSRIKLRFYKVYLPDGFVTRIIYLRYFFQELHVFEITAVILFHFICHPIITKNIGK